jgi:exosome complex RNA-binding protein Rrp42 (RNase PH superfamily)
MAGGQGDRATMVGHPSKHDPPHSMQTVILSKGEKLFQEALIAKGIRIDGRESLESRRFTTEPNPLPLSPASCRVIWGHGYGSTTEVLVSVTTEVVKTEFGDPQLSVKSLFAAFGSAVDSVEVCEVIQSTLLQFLQNSGALAPEQFVVVNSPFSWKLYIDVLVIRAAGGVYEASMIGIRESLAELTFPQLVVTPGETLAELHFDIDETKEYLRLIEKERIPFVVSFAAAANALLLDPTPLEIAVVQSLLVIGISAKGLVLGLNHFGECGVRSGILAEITEEAQKVLAQLQ